MSLFHTSQVSNWAADVLCDAQVLYAATDAWVSREVYLRALVSPPTVVVPTLMNTAFAASLLI